MPIEIDPIKSAQKRSDYIGIYRLEDLSRLRELVLSETGQVDVILKCTYDEQGLPVMLVDAKADVEVACERCGESMHMHMVLNTTYTPETRSLEEDLVPSSYEIVQQNEYGLIDFKSLVEDELILSMPLIPKHSVEECHIKENDMSWGEIDESDELKPANPFDILKNLKNPK